MSPPLPSYAIMSHAFLHTMYDVMEWSCPHMFPVLPFTKQKNQQAALSRHSGCNDLTTTTNSFSEW